MDNDSRRKIDSIISSAVNDIADALGEHAFRKLPGLLEVKISVTCAGCERNTGSSVIQVAETWMEVMSALAVFGWRNVKGKWWCVNCMREGGPDAF